MAGATDIGSKPDYGEEWSALVMNPSKQVLPMVQVDFDQVDDSDNYSSVPNGVYLCRVSEVRPRTGDDGSERWGVRWVVCDGPFAGRTAAWDSLAFNSRGLKRAKFILQRLEMPTDGARELLPSDLEGRLARVTVYARERIDPVTSRRVISNRVPFAGVEQASPEEKLLAERLADVNPPTANDPIFADDGLE